MRIWYKNNPSLLSLSQKRGNGVFAQTINNKWTLWIFPEKKYKKYFAFAVIPTVKFQDGTILSIVLLEKMPFYDQ
jgi:hypothetical protein